MRKLMNWLATQHDSFATGSALRRRAWPFVLLFLIAAQFALLVHQFEHHTQFEATTTDDCALCSFASGMAAAPPTQTVAAPFFTTTAAHFAWLEATLRQPSIALGFLARGPPADLSA